MKTPNPFNNHGFSWEAWQQGYDSDLVESNPYPDEAGDLQEFWDKGRNARLQDDKANKMDARGTTEEVGTNLVGKERDVL
jgi:hypothetical protein